MGSVYVILKISFLGSRFNFGCDLSLYLAQRSNLCVIQGNITYLVAFKYGYLFKKLLVVYIAYVVYFRLRSGMRLDTVK